MWVALCTSHVRQTNNDTTKGKQKNYEVNNSISTFYVTVRNEWPLNTAYVQSSEWMLHHNSVLGCCSSVLRNSSSQMFFKTDVLKKFANCTGKHLCRCIFSIRPSSLQLFEKETRSQASLVFFCEIYEFFKKTFLYKIP